MLLHVSVAVHVRSIINGQRGFTVKSEESITGSGSQLSVAVANPASPITHSNTVSGGQVITGLVVS